MSKIFQHSTIAVLMSGLFEGTLTIRELLEHGTIGIGTFHGMDGELVVVDGAAYQVKVDGSVLPVSGDLTTPYAAVAPFEPENKLEINGPFLDDELKAKLKFEFSSVNTLQAVRIHGNFEVMHCRSIEKQDEPYRRLADVAEDQAEFEREDVTGTLVGFYTPAIYGTVSVEEFHWHFLSDEKDFGGHVFGFTILEGIAEWQTIETLEQHFPVQNKAFMETAIDYGDLAEEIKRTE